jgi:hypothetical protein
MVPAGDGLKSFLKPASCPAYVPGIHVFLRAEENVDRRDKPGDDEKSNDGG